MTRFRLYRASKAHYSDEVEIADMPALLAFLAEHGPCVVSNDDGSRPSITIYDDYLE